MKRFFLTLMMLLLPLQPLIAADADFAHLLGDESTHEETITHMLDHFEHIAHHHDQNGSSHEDGSQQSRLHLLDCEHGCNLLVMIAVKTNVDVLPSSTEVPGYQPFIYNSPVTAPPLKPPYIAL